MASRVISNLVRSSARRSASATKPFSILRSPSPLRISIPSPKGFLFNRVAEYATAATTASEPAEPPLSKGARSGSSGTITDEFTGAGDIGSVCQVIGAMVDVRFNEKLHH